jgi:hypothetical protein
MAVDLTMIPWNRLAKLAPPGTNEADLQIAAENWALNADVYNAAADLWEEKALGIDVTNEDESSVSVGAISSVSQDGISVTYANDALAGNGLSSRISQVGQMMATVRRLRAKGKPTSPLVHNEDYNPWLNTEMPQDETIIVVDEV